MEGVNKKIIYVVAGVLALAVLAYLIFVFQKEKPPAMVQVSLSGLELTQKIAGFLEKAQLPDGSFEVYYVCSALFDEKCRPETTEGPKHAGQIILAFYDLFKATGETSYKGKADFAMKSVMEECPKKDTLRCQWNFFPIYQYYKDTKDQQYLEGMLAVSEQLLEDKSFNDFVDNNVGVKLAMLYEVTGDMKYRNRLERAAQEAVNLEDALITNGNQPLYTTEDGFGVRQRSLQTIWAVLIPAYKATGNPAYLQASRDFFDKAQVSYHVPDFSGAPVFITALLMGTEAMVDTADLVGGNEGKVYLDEARNTIQALIEGRIDMKEAPKFTGDYAFLRVKCNSEENFKDNLNNGWLARLLLRMGGEYTLRPY